MTGRTITRTFESGYVPGAVPVAVHLPADYDIARSTPYPLLLLLHGGDGSERDLMRFTPLIDAMIDDGELAPLVVAMPGARRSLYMDYRDGTECWESFIISDLLSALRDEFSIAADREQTFVGGWSMGGLGSLRIAFKHPHIFGAVAAVEPAIEAALTWDEVGARVKFWRPDHFYELIFGSPVDEKYWTSNNPATIVKLNPDRLLDLRIYMEVGDQDMLYLHEGGEFLHRILFDAGIGHDFRLVHGADHVGPSLEPRLADALAFIGRQIDPPAWADRPVIERRALLEKQQRALGIDLKAQDPRRIWGK